MAAPALDPSVLEVKFCKKESSTEAFLLQHLSEVHDAHLRLWIRYSMHSCSCPASARTTGTVTCSKTSQDYPQQNYALCIDLLMQPQTIIRSFIDLTYICTCILLGSFCREFNFQNGWVFLLRKSHIFAPCIRQGPFQVILQI